MNFARILYKFYIIRKDVDSSGFNRDIFTNKLVVFPILELL